MNQITAIYTNNENEFVVYDFHKIDEMHLWGKIYTL